VGLSTAVSPLAPDDPTTPPSGDTAGYWQQRVHYVLSATLDEQQNVMHGAGVLWYVNHSPDTLHEMYVHQYLNAFRPGSAWSAVDAREGRVRFQFLRDPDYGYERFTQAPVVDGVPVSVDYPGSPDSTVAHFRLPHALQPGDSIRVDFKWDARPSTTFRRQGRRGRSYDFAQWYPRVAVYNRLGWRPHALVPAGEFYGEFGTFDVTLVLPQDQVVGATGVVVSGDPGWRRVAARGFEAAAPESAPVSSAGAPVAVPSGYRAVRFHADSVHNFAWSTSPDYRYEGGYYVRHGDSVALHVLYRPGDGDGWAGGSGVERMRVALAWLENAFGPYPYPQYTMLHRLESGGTEFPMVTMSGGPSYDLAMHETVHQYAHGILANNEWASAWMDEGMAYYMSDQIVHDTRGLPIRYVDTSTVVPVEPIGTISDRFPNFRSYNTTVYSRGALMLGALRDVIGDSAWTRGMHDYYAMWRLKHVDPLAFRTVFEHASGQGLRWFFDQWLRHAGRVTYEIASAEADSADGAWHTRVTIMRKGYYEHPVTVRVDAGTEIAEQRAEREPVRQAITITTKARPITVILDPQHATGMPDVRAAVHIRPTSE
jgi:hypothetical protein